jgi:putative transposase
VKGRKRHFLVETLGLRLAVVVTAASVQDRDGAKPLLAILRHQYSRLRLIWADGAYAGALVDWVWCVRPWRPVRLEMTTRSETAPGFEVIPKRGIVERTLGGFNRYRRLSQEYAYRTDTSEAMIQVVMIHLMVRRLARIAPY